MLELPSGTITVLHTDVQDSTTLAMRLGDRYAGVLYEEKYDGWRVVAYKDADRVRLVSPQRPRPHAALPRAHRRGGALLARTPSLDTEVASTLGPS